MYFPFMYILNIMQYLNHESWNKHILLKKGLNNVSVREETAYLATLKSKSV